MKFKVTIRRHISAVDEFIVEADSESIASVMAIRNAADPSSWPFVTEESDAAGRVHIENISTEKVELMDNHCSV